MGFLCPSSSFSEISQPIQNLAPAEKKAYVSVQENPENRLGLIYSVKKLDEARKLIEDGDYEEAEKILIDAKNWLTDITESHYDLFQTFSKQQKNSELAKIEKAHAIDFGHVRDQAYFLLAKAYIGENKLKGAVSLLVEIIKSQSGSILAEQAYKTLQEIKFSDKAK
jgi:thioredoxin-like negative regulator of GroEL